MSKERTGVFVVTGAGSGIGRAISLKIASQGHHVFGIGRNEEKLTATQKLIPGTRFSTFIGDLADASSTQKALGQVRDALTKSEMPLLGVVNNAGVYDYISFLETSDKIWERQFSHNLMSAVRVTRELFPQLKAAAPSSVLNISSTLGLNPIANASAYSAIKAAMVSWTKSLAIEWAESKIRANCICPGLVDTPIHSRFHTLPEEHEARKEAHAMQPLGRMGTSEDIAEAAWFLLSENSSWTTGSIFSVDGGIAL